MEEELTRIRREFHAHPELSENEFETQKRILKFLKDFGVDDVQNVANTGVLAHFNFKEEGPHVLIRADIDALPIEENMDIEHGSKNSGVAHKCGHDGHLTILLGLAKKLNEFPLDRGRVSLVFQPAEETGIGARKVIEDPDFKSLQPDLVFALHNLPGYDKGQIMVREGSFTAAATSMIFKLKGRTSHAAEPEKGVNPAMAIAHIIVKADELSNNHVDSKDFSLVTPVYATLGEKAYGTSAGYGEVHLTLRAWNNQKMEELKDKVNKIVDDCCAGMDLQIDRDCVETFYANRNVPEAVEIIKNAAKDNNLKLEETRYPFKWGEDFGLFTEKFPGAMFGLGAGEDCPSLHHPEYDFPDNVLMDGVNMFYSIVQLASAK
ncbi:amidohydrolase [Halocola ammonii]